MAISVSQFWAALLDNHLADKPSCARWAKQFAQEHQVDRPRETEPLAAWLVETGHLTAYQADVLASGRSHERPLWFEPWKIAGPADSTLFSKWLWAESTTNKAVALCWILPRMPGPDSELARVCDTAVPGIHPLRLIGSRHEPAILLAPEPSGRLLEDQLRDGPLDPLATLWMAAKIAATLARVHARGSVLHALRPDRAWIEDDDEITLIPDLRIGGQPLLDDAVTDPGAYSTAPELAFPGKKADAATDIHSAGCLLFRALFGYAPRVSQGWPAELTEPTDEATRMAAQVISYALALDPRARFSSAEQMRVAATKAAQLVSAAEPRDEARRSAVAPRPNASEQHAETARDASANAASAPTSTAAAKSAAPTPAPPKAPPARDRQRAPTPPQEAKAEVAVPRQTAPAKTPPEGPAENATDLPAAGSDRSRREAGPSAPQPAEIAAPAAAASSTPARTPRAPQAKPTVAAEPPSEKAPGYSPSTPSSRTPAVSAPVDKGRAETRHGRPGPSGRKKRKKQNIAPLVIAAVSVFCILGLVLALRPGPRPESDAPRPPYTPPPLAESTPERNPAQQAPSPSTAPSNETTPVELVDSDSVLWASPSTAPAAPLELVPAGASAILRIRPAALQAADESTDLLQTFQPELNGALEEVVRRAGVPLEKMESLFVTLHEASGGTPEIAFVIQLVNPQPRDELVTAWGNPVPAQTRDGKTVLVGEQADSDAFYHAPASQESDSTGVDRFAVGPPQLIERVAEFAGAAAPLPPSIESLWRETSADADLLLVGQPNFFFAGGRQLLDRFAPNLREPLKTFLIPDVVAFSLQMSFAPQWYAELRLTPGAALTPAALAERVTKEIDALPQHAERFLLNSNPDASWRALAIRYPAMMRALEQRTRVGLSAEHVVANLYLPAPAAPNVLLATLLAANTPTSAAAPTSAPTAAQPLSLAEMLDRPMSVVFEQESLEAAAATIAELFNEDLPPGNPPLEIQLIGSDLEKAGITQNQQIRDFAYRDQPLRSVLTNLVMRANPVTTVTRPTEEDQKLVWVVSPGGEKILITTRTAAKASYELPKEFVTE